MEALGINFGYLLIQICVLTLLVAFFALPIAAIWQLRTHTFPNETDKLLWVLVILFAPIIGAIAFFILKPGAEENT